MTEREEELGIEMERAKFRELILMNPNYFGNVEGSPHKPEMMMMHNTAYEKMPCVGFNPQPDRLEAVVWINQESGYGGDGCRKGTPEYVRFYLSFDDGVTWQDQGMASFTAYDIPGEKPLEYAVTLEIDSTKLWCMIENLAKVRAILSWNNPPPPNTPNFAPVWGNVEEAYIQIDKGLKFLVADVFKDLGLELPENLGEVLDLAQPVAAAKPKPLSVAELQELYKDKDVPEHRFLFPLVQKLIANPELTESLMAPDFEGLLWELGIDPAELIGKLLDTDGDTYYEELKCIGLNPKQDTLVGVLTVKLPNGYSGHLCSAGSQEYVAFWIDWGDGAGWTRVGTTSVNVHDISSIPAEGLQYAVFLPVDLTTHRQPCEKGPKTARVRAILSWEERPSHKNFRPKWGNRQETLIHIKPGPEITPPESGVYKPYIESVGTVAVCNIDQTTGMATGEKPFGGTVSITGYIPNPPDVLSPPIKYRVSVRQLPASPTPPGPWQPLTNSFTISISEQIGGGLPEGYDAPQAIDPADGFYTYREDPNPLGGGWRRVKHRLLAKWITAAPMTGLWEIKVEAKDPSGTIFTAGTIKCVADGSTRRNVKVLLDEVAPTPEIHITQFSRGGGPRQPAVECGTFQVGDVIYGTYTTTDEHFRKLTLTVEPTGPAHGATVSPSSRTYPAVPTIGETGTWSLDTSPMDPCGYIVRLWVWDRTIANGDHRGWWNKDSVGFCLKAAPR